MKKQATRQPHEWYENVPYLFIQRSIIYPHDELCSSYPTRMSGSYFRTLDTNSSSISNSSLTYWTSISKKMALASDGSWSIKCLLDQKLTYLVNRTSPQRMHQGKQSFLREFYSTVSYKLQRQLQVPFTSFTLAADHWQVYFRLQSADTNKWLQ